MKHKRIKVIAIMCIVPILFLSIFAVAVHFGWPFFDTPTKIKKGFSQELLDTLSDQYQISIPEDAVFLKGINTNAFRDPSVVVLFELPVDTNQIHTADDIEDYIYQKLKLDFEQYGSFSHEDPIISADWYEEMGGELDYHLKYKATPFTYLSCALCNDCILVRFIGWHPHNSFK